MAPRERRGGIDGGLVARPQVAKVLVFGGGGTFSDAEIFEPATGQWTMTGSAFYKRSAARLNLLPSGRVLLVGQTFYPTLPIYSRSCETYDPGSGEWHTTGRALVERNYGVAVSLLDGRVLLSGGFVTVGGFNENLRSVEIYDPATQSWDETGELTVGRQGHTATLLRNGEVLVVGGNSAQPEPTAELYVPSTGSWRAISGPFFNRTGHTATLLNSGEVLVVGGITSPGYAETDSVELFDPRTGTWHAAGKVHTKRRYQHTATTLEDGRLLLVGGYNETSGRLASVEIFDPVASVWTNAASTSTPRSAHTATLLPDGRVLVVGGDVVTGDVATPIASGELFEPATGSWASTGNLNVGRAGHAAALFEVKDIPLPVG